MRPRGIFWVSSKDPITGVFLMKNKVNKVFSGAILSFLMPLSLAQIPVDCYPVCSEAQIASAKRYLEAEISALSKKHKVFESKVNLVQNDISFARFNQRRGQIGSVVKSTSTTGSATQYNSGGSSGEVEALSAKLEKLEGTMFDLEKEKGVLTAYLDDFSTLVPKKPQKSQPQKVAYEQPIFRRP